MRTAPRSRGGIVHRERKDPRVATVGATLLTRQKIEIGHEMDLVEIKLGGQTLHVHYVDALQVAKTIEAHARQCKRIMHHPGRIWYDGSVLTNAEENYKFGR